MSALVNSTTPVVFTEAELWLLRSCIRHEMQGQEPWKFPPVSLELNDQIAHALYACDLTGETSYTLLLSRGDCLAMDYTVSQDARDADGRLIGKNILRKVCEARVNLMAGNNLTSEEPPLPSKAELSSIIDGWKEAETAQFMRNRRRKAKP